MYYVRFQTNQNKYMLEFCTQRTGVTGWRSAGLMSPTLDRL